MIEKSHLSSYSCLSHFYIIYYFVFIYVIFIIIVLFIILNLYFIFNLYLIDENCSLKPVTNKLNLKISLHNKNPILINIPIDSNYDHLLTDLKPCYKNQSVFKEQNLSINYDHNLLNSKITYK